MQCGTTIDRRFSVEQADAKPGALHDGVARLLSQPSYAGQIDVNEAPSPLLDLAGNEYRFHVAGIHEIGDRAVGVAVRPDIEAVGAEHNEIGVLAGGERADPAVEIGATRANPGMRIRSTALITAVDSAETGISGRTSRIVPSSIRMSARAKSPICRSSVSTMAPRRRMRRAVCSRDCHGTWNRSA